MKKKKTLAAAALVLALLAAAYWYGGDAPGLQGWTAGGGGQSGTDASLTDPLPQEDRSSQTPPETPGQAQDGPGGEAEGQTDRDPAPDQSAPPAAGQADVSLPEGQPDASLPEELPDAGPSEEQARDCFLSIRCTTVLDHPDWLEEGKEEIIPADGVILAETALQPQEGESAFSLLQRAALEAGIHLEFSITPGAGSAYVEGIGNLYEFDCGQQSGWLYLVNGVSPSCSCSEYLLQPGDRVEWVYTCDMGQDVGAVPAGGQA